MYVKWNVRTQFQLVFSSLIADRLYMHNHVPLRRSERQRVSETRARVVTSSCDDAVTSLTRKNQYCSSAMRKHSQLYVARRAKPSRCNENWLQLLCFVSSRVCVVHCNTRSRLPCMQQSRHNVWTAAGPSLNVYTFSNLLILLIINETKSNCVEVLVFIF